MSYDQCLMSKNNLFAKSWIAGTRNGALLKRQDIETVDVPATCEKLHLAIKQQTNGENGKKSHSEWNIPFRIISNLCYGTLRIYQRQVIYLLEMSRDLVARSKCEIKPISAPKRKYSTNTTYGCKKKKRLTQVTQNTSIPNYSELLDDLDNWQKISDNQLPSKIQSSSKHSSVLNLQIREITMREISAEFDIPTENDNDDEGFGNATNEELAEFINFFADETGVHSSNIKNTKKRKASIECALSDKVLKTNDDTIEAARCADITADFTTLPKACKTKMNRHSREKQLNCNDAMITNSAERQLNKTIVDDDINRAEITTPLTFSSPSIGSIQNTAAEKNAAATTSKGKVSSKSKLIIDKCVRFNELELRAQIENYKKLQYAPLAEFKQNLRRRKLRTAHELLNNFNRNNFGILKHVFKQKRKVNKESITNEYLHILCAILEHNIDDNLAEQVFPNWNRDDKKKHNQNAANIISNMDELNVEINNNNYNINNNFINEMAAGTSGNQESPQLYPSNADDTTNNDWSPYGVMMKLLDIWRASKSDDEINAKQFLLSSKNRINAALGFSSLLILAAQNFVIITKAVDLIDVHSIKLGTASIELINDVQKTTYKNA